MKKLILLFLLFPIFILSGCKEKKKNDNKQPLGYDHYVSIEYGNDKNPGTFEKPFKTIQKGINQAEAGNTVCIMEGKYNEAITIKNSGTINNYITLLSYPGDKAILDGTGINLSIPSQALICLENAHYIKIEGLNISTSQSCGIYGKDGSSNIIIEKCSISNCLAPGICFGADFIATKNIKVLNNYVENCALVSREAISLRTVDNFEIAYNTVADVFKESIDTKSGCKNGSIHHNKIVNSGVCAIYLDAGYYNKPINDGQYNIDVYQNEIINPRAIGICVASEMGNKTHNILIYNNLIYDLNYGQGSGIKIADHTDDASDRMGEIKNIYIYQNTIYGRGQQGIYVNHPTIENIVIRNNISAQNKLPQIKIKEGAGIDENQVIIENNLHWGTASGDNYGTNAIKADPKFVNIQNKNFTLQSNSPAIDSAINLNVANIDFIGTKRPQGNGYDIGAYEYIP